MVKRITSLIITLLVSALIMPAQAAINENFINNPGFETVTGNKPTIWSLSKSGGQTASWGNDAVLSTDRNSGTYGARISSSTYGENITISQTNYSMTGRTEYTFSAYIKVENLGADSYAQMKVDMLNSSRQSVGSIGDTISRVTGGYQLLSKTFISEEECAIATFQLRLIGTGAVYYDDVSVMQISEPEKMVFKSDQVFYYSDEESKKGTLNVTINSYYLSSVTGGKAVFSIADGTYPLYNSGDIQITGSIVSAEFPISALLTKKRAYKAKVTLYDKEGQEFTSGESFVYKYDRPKYLTADGTYLKNGKDEFEPVFAYHVSPSDYPVAKNAGINVVQSNLYTRVEDYVATLEAAKNNGMMVLLAMYRGMKPAGHDSNASFTDSVVKAVRSHEALFAYAIMDEPFLGNPQIGDDLRKSYAMIRNLDDNHPIYLVEGAGSHYEEAAKYADIFAVDPYPANINTPLTVVSTAVTKAVAAAGGRKPVYALLQTFRNNGYLPLGHEVRNMIYQAMFSGAKAVGYFSFSDADKDNEGKNIPMQGLESWQSLTSFYELELADVYDIFSKGLYEYTSYKTDDVLSIDYTRNSENYRIVLNLKKQNTTAVIPTIGASARTQVEIINGSGAAHINAGFNSISITLSENAAVKMRIIRGPGPNYDMENTDENGFITDFTVTSGQASADNESVLNNPSQKLKISNSESTTTTVETEILPEALSAQEHYEVSAGFTIKELSEGSGLKMSLLSSDNSKIAETEYFKLTSATYSFWRTMMAVTTADLTNGAKLVFEFSGKGTAYIDNINVEKVKYYVNGEFEGLTSDGVPAGWQVYSGSNPSLFITNPQDTTSAGIRLKESENGNYVWSYNCTRLYSIRQNISKEYLSLGNVYSVTASHKSTANGLGFYTAEGIALPQTSGDGTHATWTRASAEWKDSTIYMLYETAGTFLVAFRPHNAGDLNWYLDNVRMEKVVEGTYFTDENGAELENIKAGTVNVKYIKPEKNFVSPAVKTVLFALYQLNNGVKNLSKVILGKDISGSMTIPNDVPASNYDIIGAVPLQAYGSFNVPNDYENYEISVFVWNSAEGIIPTNEKVTLK